jgi:hypothetical protein
MVDLTKLEKLTNELEEDIKGIYNSGLLYDFFRKYFDSIKNNIAIIRTIDKRVLFVNKYTKNQLKNLDIQRDKWDDVPCIGHNGGCPIGLDNCPVQEVADTNKIIINFHIKGPETGNLYTLICMPLNYNSIKAVIEMWVEENG